MLVHGLVSGRYLVPVAERLAARGVTAVPDLPGFGPSEAPSRALDVPGLADVLAAWMRSNAVGGATVLGHSMGAQVVLDLAVRHPDLVGRLVLAGPMGDPAAGGVTAYAARWARCLPREPLSLHPVLLRDATELGPRFAFRTLRRAAADPTAEKLERCPVPALIVRGQHDHIAPAAWCRAMADLLPRAEVATVAGAAHTVNWAAPDRLADLVTGFASH